MTAHPPIKLFQFPRIFGIPNVSPFCCKLETWLRIAGIPYEVVDTPDPRKGPKGKLPFIEDAGVRIADTSLIVDHLVMTRGVDPDARLDASQRAIAPRAAHPGRTLRVRPGVHAHPSGRGLAAYAHQVRLGACDRPPAGRQHRARTRREDALEAGCLAPLARGYHRIGAARLARGPDRHVRRAVLLRRRAHRGRRDRLRRAGHVHADADRIADPRLPEVAASVCRLCGADARALFPRPRHCAFAASRRAYEGQHPGGTDRRLNERSHPDAADERIGSPNSCTLIPLAHLSLFCRLLEHSPVRNRDRGSLDAHTTRTLPVAQALVHALARRSHDVAE